MSYAQPAIPLSSAAPWHGALMRLTALDPVKWEVQRQRGQRAFTLPLILAGWGCAATGLICQAILLHHVHASWSRFFSLGLPTGSHDLNARHAHCLLARRTAGVASPRGKIPARDSDGRTGSQRGLEAGVGCWVLGTSARGGKTRFSAVLPNTQHLTPNTCLYSSSANCTALTPPFRPGPYGPATRAWPAAARRPRNRVGASASATARTAVRGSLHESLRWVNTRCARSACTHSAASVPAARLLRWPRMPGDAAAHTLADRDPRAASRRRDSPPTTSRRHAPDARHSDAVVAPRSYATAARAPLARSVATYATGSHRVVRHRHGPHGQARQLERLVGHHRPRALLAQGRIRRDRARRRVQRPAPTPRRRAAPRTWSRCSCVTSAASTDSQATSIEASRASSSRIGKPASISTRVPAASTSTAFPRLPRAERPDSHARSPAGQLRRRPAAAAAACASPSATCRRPIARAAVARNAIEAVAATASSRRPR